MYVISFTYEGRPLRQMAADDVQRDKAIEFIENTPGTKNVVWIYVPDPEPEPAPA